MEVTVAARSSRIPALSTALSGSEALQRSGAVKQGAAQLRRARGTRRGRNAYYTEGAASKNASALHQHAAASTARLIQDG